MLKQIWAWIVYIILLATVIVFLGIGAGIVYLVILSGIVYVGSVKKPNSN